MSANSSSLDSLIMFEDDIFRYNGHHKMEKYNFVKDEDQATTASISADESTESIKEWLRPSKINKDDLERWREKPAIKILMIETHNQFSANPEMMPSHRTIPGLTEITPLAEREPQARMIREIFRHACLPLAALGSFIKGHLTFLEIPTCRITGEDDVDGGMVTAYYCSGTSWVIALSYFHTTQHTSAVLLYREGDGRKRRDEVEVEILRLKDYIAHPMLLVFVKTKISLIWTFNLLEKMNGETLAIEKSIGLSTWDWILDREVRIQEEDQGEDAEIYIANAHKKAVERYNILSGMLNNIRFRLKTLREQISWVQRCNNTYLTTLNADSILARQQCNELDEIMIKITYFTNIHLYNADALQERLSNQMSSLFHLTNQRDSRVNLAIADINNDLAWEGKITNSAMKTLAFVNVLFLPGTFVGSFFSTPIFNWTNTADQVVTVRPFVIFWTICVVLTLGLCIGWYVYLHFTRRLDQEKRKVARREFRQRILKPPTLARIEDKLRRKLSSSLNQHSSRGWLSWVRRLTSPVDEEAGLSVIVGVPGMIDQKTAEQPLKSKQV